MFRSTNSHQTAAQRECKACIKIIFDVKSDNVRAEQPEVQWSALLISFNSFMKTRLEKNFRHRVLERIRQAPLRRNSHYLGIVQTFQKAA